MALIHQLKNKSRTNRINKLLTIINNQQIRLLAVHYYDHDCLISKFNISSQMSQIRGGGIWRMSNLFIPKQTPKKDWWTERCKSATLLFNNGHTTGSFGLFSFLPLGYRSLDKLVKVIDTEMISGLGAQKMSMPALVDSRMLESTGRVDAIGEELFALNDRHNFRWYLAPTHEETITNIVGSFPGHIPEKRLPLGLYQVTNKYRDERRPRFGLFRAREFMMKDLYSFHTSQQSAEEYYANVCQSYENILNKLTINYIKASGTSGSMGGIYSHEYLIPSDVGEDKIITCLSCSYKFNQQLAREDAICPKCSSPKHESILATEVAHTFLLGTKYSDVLNARFINSQTNKLEPFFMGCFGVGVSRLLAAIVESLHSNAGGYSSDEEPSIKLPSAIAPFTVAVVPPKAGSDEDTNEGRSLIASVCDSLEKCDLDVLLDNRTEMTIGHRIKDLLSHGIPYILVGGRTLNRTLPQFELITRNEETNFVESKEIFNHLQVISFFEKLKLKLPL